MKTTKPQPSTVIFADDDSDEFYLFNEALEHSSINVNLVNVKDGKKLLAYLDNHPLPDIIFMDLNMPYKDGMETLTELRKNEQYNNIPVIIFSTSKNVNYIKSCFEKGANYYIIKPESFDDIIKAVKKIFSIDWKRQTKQPSFEDFILKY